MTLGSDPDRRADTVAALVSAINGDSSSLVTAEDGMKALAVSLAAIESIGTGAVVSL